MIRDEKAQWIIISGFTISIALAILIVLLNMSFMSGHQSSQAEIDFPMYELRELYDETYAEVNAVSMQVNTTDEEDDTETINRTMVNFGECLSQLYAYHGQLVTTTVETTTNDTGIMNITTLNVNITFDDGITQYREHLWSEI